MNKKWLWENREYGLKEVACELAETIGILKEAYRYIELANKKMEENSVTRPGDILEKKET